MLVFKTNAGEVSAALRQIAREYPRQYPAVLATIGLGLRKKIVEWLPRGTTPLSFKPYHALTVALKIRKLRRYRASDARKLAIESAKRTKAGTLTSAARKVFKQRRASISGFGGRLREKDLLLYNTGGRGAEKSVRVGYRNNNLSGIAKKFQSSEIRPLNKNERAFRHRIQGKNIDASYRRPAREIFKPTANSAEVRDYILRVAKGRLESILKKEASKVKAV